MKDLWKLINEHSTTIAAYIIILESAANIVGGIIGVVLTIIKVIL